MLRTAESRRSMHYQIIDHRLYRNDQCTFPARFVMLVRLSDRYVNSMYTINVHLQKPCIHNMLLERGRLINREYIEIYYY